MTDGIGRIGGSNYGYVGFGPQKKGNETAEYTAAQPQVTNNETQVDPAKVMDFMAANNFFVAPTETKGVGDVDVVTQERIQGYMENFEFIYGLIAEEFGEELATAVMDICMDYLMGMAA